MVRLLGVLLTLAPPATPAGNLITIQEGENDDDEEEFDDNDAELCENFLVESYDVSEPVFEVGRRNLDA